MTDHCTGLRLDAIAIRVLAHPLRSRLLSRLRTAGPATATELAEALGTNTGATSYHLRKLESVGLVTDSGDGAGKRRPWRASTDFHAWNRSEFADDEDATTALGWLERSYIRQLTTRAEAWQDALEGWPPEWADACGLGDTMITANPSQLAELRSELDEVLARYRHAGDGDPDARRISIFSYVCPTDLTAPETASS
ncbi:MAG: helix-turn-helix domain-containing protein [Propionibacteriaceae bacterium]